MRLRSAILLLPLMACAASPGGTASATIATTGTTDAGEASAPTSGSSGAASTGDTSTGAVMDGLRLNHLQAMGTHNSYHVSSGHGVKELDYTHRPLPDQLASGARQFELDIHFAGPGEPIAVYHLEVLDQGTTCPRLTDCLQALRGWSDANPEHQLLYVMLEFKSVYDVKLVDELMATLEAQILAVWPRERIVAPDDVQRGAASLREGVEAAGWPTIDASRGKILLVLHDPDKWRDHYVAGGTAGRLLFPDAFADVTAPFAAVHTLNDPTADAAAIAAALDAGHLVRTRADSDNVEPFASDDSRAIAALASGATFISTDYPPPKGDLDYVFAIPDGNPSRCNPRTAPPDCTPEQIEDL